MNRHTRVEAAIRTAGGDFSQASIAVCRILDEEIDEASRWLDDIEDIDEPSDESP